MNRFTACLLLLGCGSTAPAPAISAPNLAPTLTPLLAGERSPGGATTVNDSTATALGRAANNLSSDHWPELLAGKRIFRRIWSSAAKGPGSGLGPLYNGTSCNDCHFRDGRGGRPSDVTPDVRLLGRLALVKDGRAEPTYGSQLSERAVPGLESEGRLLVDYYPFIERFPDGSVHELRRPNYRIATRTEPALDESAALSPRMPGALVGLGLLEAIPEGDIVARADPEDRDGDGVSGRVSWVPRADSNEKVLGRFGWKATQPSVLAQIATAFREDMGLTSWLRPKSACTRAQPECARLDRANEVSGRELAQLTNYVRLLGVPARRDVTSVEVRRGQDHFFAVGCAACHAPRYVTAQQFELGELASQVIFPYTDLLLHDLGDELGDEVADLAAAGREWRTPPLWGLGLLRTIHGRLRLLHDGRARTVEEAILWHDGEGARARKRYAALDDGQRQDLLRFVESL